MISEIIENRKSGFLLFHSHWIIMKETKNYMNYYKINFNLM